MKNPYRIALSMAVAITLASPMLVAQLARWPHLHAQDDADAARKSGLQVAAVRSLRQSVGVSDDSQEFIANIDTTVLSKVGMLVLSTYGGTAGCVRFWVFSRSGDSFKQVWSMDQAGDEANFCADQKCPLPIVKIKENRDVLVNIPSFQRGRCAIRSSGRFEWSGSGYTYKGIVPTASPDR